MDLRALVKSSSTWKSFHGSLNACASSRFTDLCTRQTGCKRAQVKFLNQKSLKSYFQTHKGCKPPEVLCRAQRDGAPGLSYVVIKTPLSRFPHGTQTQHVHALADLGQTGCRLAAEGLGLVVWSQHAGRTRGSALHRIAGMLSVFVWPKRLGAAR